MLSVPSEFCISDLIKEFTLFQSHGREIFKKTVFSSIHRRTFYDLGLGKGGVGGARSGPRVN